MQRNDRFESSLTEDGRYRLLLNAVTDYAIYMLDINGIISSWNAGAQRFKGYEADEIIGEHFSRFYRDEDRAAGMPKRALEIAEREGRFEGEGWRVRKDGNQFWAHVIIDPIRSPTGDLLGYAKITRDFTERKASDDALKRSQEQFRILVQGVTDYAIYMLDPDGNVASWNAGAERIKGYAPSEIIGQHFSKFYTQEDLDAGMPQHALDTARSTGRYEKEGWRVRKDGSRFSANVVIDAVRDDAGNLIGFAKVTRDVTERNKAQDELAKAREALFQSQKMEAIGQLTGGVAHDFNNLLMAVLGSLELVRKRVDTDPRTMALLDNAVQAAQRGANLTKRMLAFARRQELDLQRVDIPGLVRGMAELLQRSLGPTISVETRFPLTLEAVRADPNQLELALLNLAVNARDAMPNGGTILISASLQAGKSGVPDWKEGNYICLSVTDQGLGMDKTTMLRAIEPFFTTKGIGKGTGLGLSMVHGLMRQSGGELVLKSEIGKGTTAELWLPVDRGSDQAVPSGSVSAELAGKGQKPQKILAVDDDVLVLLNTVAMLEDLGHTVIEASSGRQALELLSKENFDLVITDQAMPNMTGAQLIEAIKRQWPNMPVILATGYAELPDGAQLDIPLLSKPFRQMDLLQKIAAATEF
ncbi:hybrid sensor histidine kinase/response regulator [Phyllobacterium endophyticum]|uniref:hybrid sensor histidine kinase/response regulator n=1 Tax=Phyllobacterium endophyticum TaxID=1149773 RepID=UPI0011C865F4|nr:PAS domain-containing sensor histidine kinase [Phyllobacterium endophyticum]TXR46364.1 PAS domain S-box protein [Phyllobacterium endophyticum]